MVRATSWQVYGALSIGGITNVVVVDDLNDTVYFDGSFTASSIRAILDPLEWTATVLINAAELDPVDPYTQYLNTTRHDQLIRHELGVSVPRDTTKIDVTYLDTDGTLAANSDTKIASQKAVKTYIDTTAIDVTYLDTDGTLAANSDTKIASQKAVKTYIDTTALAYAIALGG